MPWRRYCSRMWCGLILLFLWVSFICYMHSSVLVWCFQIVKHEYGHRVRDIEHAVFTPLVFSSTRSMGCEATVFCRRLADLHATHWGQDYSQTISWLRYCLSFTLLWCAIMCIRGSGSSAHHPVLGPSDLSVVLTESRLTNYTVASIILLLFSFFSIGWFHNYFTNYLAMVTNDDCDFWCDCLKNYLLRI